MFLKGIHAHTIHDLLYEFFSSCIHQKLSRMYFCRALLADSSSSFQDVPIGHHVDTYLVDELFKFKLGHVMG